MPVKYENSVSGGGGGGGTVSGTGVDNHVARWDGTANIQSSVITLSDVGVMDRASGDWTLSTSVSGDINIESFKDVDFLIPANGEILINASTTPHTLAGGVVDLNMTTATATLSGFDASVTVTADVSNVKGVDSSITKTTNGLTTGNLLACYTSTSTGHASDAGGEYLHYAAGSHSKNGGTSVSVAFDAGQTNDYAFRSEGGDHLFSKSLVDPGAFTTAWIQNTLNITTTGNNANPVVGVNNIVTYSSNDDLTSPSQPAMISEINEIQFSGTGQIDKVECVSSFIKNTSTGTIDSANGFVATVFQNSGTINEFVAYDAGNATIGSDPTVSYFLGSSSSFISNSRAVRTKFGGGTNYLPISDADTGITFDSTDLVLATTTSGNVVLSPTGLIDLDGGRAIKISSSGAGDYTVLLTDYIISKTGITGGGNTVTLPSSPATGQIFVISDAAGGSGTDNITVDTDGAPLINGAATAVLSSDYSSISLYFNGTDYLIY